MAPKKSGVLRDSSLAKRGFGAFSGSSVAEHGQVVEFRYPSGDRYAVPVEYIRSWSERNEDNASGTACAGLKDVTALRVRRLAEGHLVRIYFADGSRQDIAWDTVLMACEPLYEHFGGLTEKSRNLTAAWCSSEAGFRMERSQR